MSVSVSHVIHISDLHFGARSKREFVDLSKELEQQVKELLESKKAPIILVTGDVVDDAAKAQYYDAQKFFKGLVQSWGGDTGVKILFCPGNHDYGWNGIFASRSNLKRFSSSFMEFLPSHAGDKDLLDFPVVHSFDFPGAAKGAASAPRTGQEKKIYFIGLDSMQDETGPLDRFSAEGELGVKQLKELERILLGISKAGHEETITIIYLHHDPWDNEPFMNLKDSTQLQTIIKSYKVDLLLYGHSHRDGVEKLASKNPNAKRGCCSSTTVSRRFFVWDLITDINNPNPKKQFHSY